MQHRDGEGWKHGAITLILMPNDPQYQPLVFVPKDERAVKVVVEWDAVIGPLGLILNCVISFNYYGKKLV